MKTLFTLLLLSTLTALPAQAIEFDTSMSGEATACYRYSPWTGLCNGVECIYPDNQQAIDQVLEQLKPDDHFYGCDQRTPYVFDYAQEISSDGHRICLSTKTSAGFRCRAAW